jgi:hypothetical protein
MSLISLELIDRLTGLNFKILNQQINNPARLAAELEEIAIDAWNEAKELGMPTWENAEMLPPSIRIDP